MCHLWWRVVHDERGCAVNAPKDGPKCPYLKPALLQHFHSSKGERVLSFQRGMGRSRPMKRLPRPDQEEGDS